MSSHLLPASVYKLLRDVSEKNPNPIIIANGLACTTSVQVQKPFLCSECEGLFSKCGERVCVGQCARFDRFPLREKLKTVTPLVSGPELALFDLRQAFGDEADSFAYFAASVFWRASVTRWANHDGKQLDPINLGPYE